MHRRELLTLTSLALIGHRILLPTSAWAQPAQPPIPPVFGSEVQGLRLGLVVYNSVAIDFVLENTSASPIVVLSHVVGGTQENLDWYEMLATPRGNAALSRRVVHFTEPRERSATVTQTIAPHATLRHAISMSGWTVAAVNMVPTRIAGGNYDLTVTYDTTRTTPGPHWRGRITSGTVASMIQT
jgi:hypothetical protein